MVYCVLVHLVDGTLIITLLIIIISTSCLIFFSYAETITTCIHTETHRYVNNYANSCYTAQQ